LLAKQLGVLSATGTALYMGAEIAWKTKPEERTMFFLLDFHVRNHHISGHIIYFGICTGRQDLFQENSWHCLNLRPE